METLRLSNMSRYCLFCPWSLNWNHLELIGLCYATQVWSPFRNRKLSEKIESVQRRATGWILKTKTGEMSYTERLLALELLPLCYDREIKDLVFFFKALYGYINLDIDDAYLVIALQNIWSH